ncbi:MAG: hypothetical protein J6C55_03375 [Oscillospiraceae bacterium]|nr:hypothetical protein [Oscillospiraceae bacterium]
MKKINFKRYKNLLENIIFIFSLILAYIIQTSCKFKFIYNTLPIIILAVILSISMFKNIGISCIYGLFAGILCDMALNIPVGISCFVFIIICSAVSLLTIYYFKANLSTFSFFIIIFVLIENIIINIFKYNTISLFDKSEFCFKQALVFGLIIYIISLPIFLFFNYINNSWSDKDIFFTKK